MSRAARPFPKEIAVKDARYPHGVAAGGRCGRGPRVGHRAAPARRRGAAISLFLMLNAAAGPMASWAAAPENPPPQYSFYLRSGTVVQTSRYWEEGDEYRLERFGGVIGLSKADVLRIERIEPQAPAAPAPTPSPARGSPESAPEAVRGVSSLISAYITEMIAWLHAWIARLGTARRGGAAAQIARGGATRGRGAAPREQRLPLPVLIGVAVAIPILVLSGKRLGGWLFSETRT